MLTILVVVVATFVLAWLANRSRRRAVTGMCVRCGKRAAVRAAIGTEAQLRMCEPCAGTTDRNHNAAVWFFVSLAAVMVVGAGTGIISDLAFGFKIGWEYALILVMGVGLPLALAFMIRGRNSSNRP